MMRNMVITAIQGAVTFLAFTRMEGLTCFYIMRRSIQLNVKGEKREIIPQ